LDAETVVDAIHWFQQQSLFKPAFVLLSTKQSKYVQVELENG
jgi:hypothetical protein